MPVEYYPGYIAAKKLGCHVGTWLETVKKDPKTQPFPVVICGRNVKVPKIPFDDFIEACTAQTT